MIFIIPKLKKGKFEKLMETLVGPKDYFIFDATDSDDNGETLKDFSGVISTEGIAPPERLISAMKKKDEDEIDYSKVERLEDKYFKNKRFIAAALAITKTFKDADGDINLFIVLEKNAYKFFGKKIMKRFRKIMDVDFNFIFDLEDVKEKKKLLKATPKGSEIDEFKKHHKKLIKKLSDK